MNETASYIFISTIWLIHHINSWLSGLRIINLSKMSPTRVNEFDNLVYSLGAMLETAP